MIDLTITAHPYAPFMLDTDAGQVQLTKEEVERLMFLCDVCLKETDPNWRHSELDLFAAMNLEPVPVINLKGI